MVWEVGGEKKEEEEEQATIDFGIDSFALFRVCEVPSLPVRVDH